MERLKKPGTEPHTRSSLSFLDRGERTLESSSRLVCLGNEINKNPNKINHWWGVWGEGPIIDCLLHNHYKLSSDPWHPWKSLAWCDCNPTTVTNGQPLDLRSQPSRPAELLVKQETLSQNLRCTGWGTACVVKGLLYQGENLSLDFQSSRKSQVQSLKP